MIIRALGRSSLQVTVLAHRVPLVARPHPKPQAVADVVRLGLAQVATLVIGDPPLGSQADHAILLRGASLDKCGEFYPDDSGDFVSDGDRFEIRGPRQFYSRNYTAWNRLIAESEKV